MTVRAVLGLLLLAIAARGLRSPGRAIRSTSTLQLPLWNRLSTWWDGGEQQKPSALPVPDTSTQTTTSKKKNDYRETIIVGAGMAGLSCATYLQRFGYKNILVLEADSGPGGRVRTDSHPEGYLLDRGFQVFIEEYPEARRLIGDEGYSALDLRQFRSGALVYKDGALQTVSDPLRCPEDLVGSILSPVGSFVDKAKVGLYSMNSRFRESLDDVLARPETTTLSFLQERLQLSEVMIDSFFKPFYQGIFLAPLEKQSSRLFEFVFKMFASGAAALPAEGMGKVASRVAGELGEGVVVYNAGVSGISRKDDKTWTVTTSASGGADYDCSNLVLATDPEAFKRLISAGAAGSADGSIPEGRASLCLYYGLDDKDLPPEANSPTLILNGELGTGGIARVNNVCFPSLVAPKYAPKGKHLCSVTIVGASNAELHEVVLDSAVRQQLGDWWGHDRIKAWKLLRTYRIPYAQPAQTPPYALERPVKTQESGLYVGGDHRGTATLNGAIRSGRLVAQSIIKLYV